MIKKLIISLLNLIFINKLLLKYKMKNFKKINFENSDFMNLSFENNKELKEIFFSKKFFLKKSYDESSVNYHTFAWLSIAKKLGGASNVTLSKKHIINWNKKNYTIFSFIWDEIFISKRLLNLIYSYDFFAISATEKERNIFKFIILKNFLILKFKTYFLKNKEEQPIEIFKALLLLNSIYGNNTDKNIKQINKQISYQINESGLHKSANPSAHAEFINDLNEQSYFNLT